jgi:glycine dehydrogenase subunit 2
MTEPTVYELSVPGRCGTSLLDSDVPEADLPHGLVRKHNGLPSLSQQQVIRHYLHLSQQNYGVDTGFYPLGSCTMKYNPKASELVARLEGFAQAHPLQPEDTVQGCLTVMFRLQEMLKEIGGFSEISLQPAAGAHGELTGLLMIKAYLRDRSETGRCQVLVPDSAHGTNPASSAMAGFEVIELPTDHNGNIELAALKAACGDKVAALMLTNPNTLGLFEQQIEEVIACVHGCGGLVYGDGANMNALTGILRPGDLGIDVMHFNLHKTFGAPHGGGGPGSGPVGAGERLKPYLPGPVIVRTGTAGAADRFSPSMPEHSIGRMAAHFGNFAVILRSFCYILMHGAAGLKANAQHAVLNANYLKRQLAEYYPVPYQRTCMHEFVCQGRPEGTSARAVDVSKRLMDFGFHPPTNYFPLIVPEALMIEPPETEDLETLDRFVEAMRTIAEEARTTPEKLTSAPTNLPVGRLDETGAARHFILTDPAASASALEKLGPE